jgi:hypothetical protein
MIEEITYVVYKSNAFHMHMFLIKSILEEFDDVLSNGIFGGETLGPRQENT